MRGLHVAEAGNEHKLTITQMQNSNFSLANRKQLADLLGHDYNGLRDKAKSKYRNAEHNLRRTLTEEYSEKKGASKLVTQIEGYESKIKELNAEIAVLGFRFEDGDLSLKYGDSNPLKKLIDERIEKELGSEESLHARFDSAQLAMMTVASLEDAEKLLKSVSEI